MAEHKNKNDINQVLSKILNQYSRITPRSIQLFTKVQYPIAILEMDMDEKTFEDFDFVQLTVLKLINAGFCDAVEIADLIGLQGEYVKKIIDLLEGYGHITESGITELGEDSLRESKKITYIHVKQRFQADALSGDLLRLGEQIKEDYLYDSGSTTNKDPIAPHIDGVTKEKVQSQLANPQDYKRYHGDNIHVNVENIDDVQCIGLYYVDAYMLKLKNADEPFIFAKQFDSSQKGASRFVWRPIRLIDRNAGIKYGFSASIPCYEKEAADLIKQLYALVAHRACWVTKKDYIMQSDIINELKTIYGFFNYSYITINMNEVDAIHDFPGLISVQLSADAFEMWDDFVFRFLQYFDQKEGFLVCDHRLNGLVLHFDTQDTLIKSCSQHLQMKLESVKHDDFRDFKVNLQEFLDEEAKISQSVACVDFKKIESIIDGYKAEKENK